MSEVKNTEEIRIKVKDGKKELELSIPWGTESEIAINTPEAVTPRTTTAKAPKPPVGKTQADAARAAISKAERSAADAREAEKAMVETGVPDVAQKVEIDRNPKPVKSTKTPRKTNSRTINNFVKAIHTDYAVDLLRPDTGEFEELWNTFRAGDDVVSENVVTIHDVMNLDWEAFVGFVRATLADRGHTPAEPEPTRSAPVPEGNDATHQPAPTTEAPARTSDPDEALKVLETPPVETAEGKDASTLPW